MTFSLKTVSGEICMEELIYCILSLGVLRVRKQLSNSSMVMLLHTGIQCPAAGQGGVRFVSLAV